MRSDGTCTSCGARIRWAVHATTGKRIPLNVEHHDGGNVVVVEWRNQDGTPWEGAPVGSDVVPLPVVGVGKKAMEQAISLYRYTTHFATCPKASQHRRRR